MAATMLNASRQRNACCFTSSSNTQMSGLHQLRLHTGLGLQPCPSLACCSQSEAACIHAHRVQVHGSQAALCLSATEPPNVDYQQLLNRHKQGQCPALLLAPMENLMDRPARIALKQSIGGFDEACTEFIRVPGNSDHPAATTRGITTTYNACELGDTPLAAQLMGSNTQLLAAAAERLVNVKRAPRIDLNCGCPANVVTGGGAGSSLLKDPAALAHVVAALVEAVGQQVPVSVKMRSGFDDTSLYHNNLLAVQEAGAAFVTIHPRTKRQAYNGRADWDLIAEAKQLLSIPVVGNGDVVSVDAALAMLRHTGCDGIMIGRGALQDPLLFHRIKAHFKHTSHRQAPVDMPAGGHNPGGEQGAWLWQQQQQQVAFSQLCDPLVHHQQQQGVHPLLCQQSSGWHLSQPGGEAAVVETFLRRYASYGFDGRAGGAAALSQSGRIGRLKKVMKYVFSGQPQLRAACCRLLRAQPGAVTADKLLEDIVAQVRMHWQEGGPPELVLVSHFTMPGRLKTDQMWQLAEQQQMPA